MAIESALFKPNTNLVMACHITGVYDVNRNTTLAEDSYELVKDWAESITAANLQGIIFHNNFSETTSKIFESENISLKSLIIHISILMFSVILFTGNFYSGIFNKSKEFLLQILPM